MSSPTQPIQIQFSPPPAFELSSTSSLAAPDPTNTLALLLPHPFLFHPPILALLRAHYASYGNLHTWAPIRAFGRVILVYYTDDDAMRAKREGDRLEVGGNADRVAGGGYFPMPASSEAAGTQDESMRDYQRNQEDKGLHEKERNPSLTLRLYLAAPTIILPPDDSSQHLHPPALTKNFLISPPGSPPDGWEPILEDPPNSNTLAEDLMRALEQLSVYQTELAAGHRPGGVKMLLEETPGTLGPEEGVARAGPSVTVQDFGEEEDERRKMEERQAGMDATAEAEIFESLAGYQRAMTVAAGAPGRIGEVKATIESMGGGASSGLVEGDVFGSGYADAFSVGRIVPTAMPPRR